MRFTPAQKWRVGGVDEAWRSHQDELTSEPPRRPLNDQHGNPGSADQTQGG